MFSLENVIVCAPFELQRKMELKDLLDENTIKNVQKL